MRDQEGRWDGEKTGMGKRGEGGQGQYVTYASMEISQ